MYFPPGSLLTIKTTNDEIERQRKAEIGIPMIGVNNPHDIPILSSE